MASSINASTSGAGGLISTADSSGVLNIQTAGTTAISVDASQNVTLTNALPVASGGTGLTTLGPAFSVYSSGTQTVPSGTYTKILLQTEEYDTNNNFASSRFTPTVAGYYQINWAISASPFASSYFFASLYKNGASYKFGNNFPTSSGGGPTAGGSSLVYFNGSTDYVEIYGLSNVGFTTNSAADNTWMNGVLVRAA